MKFSGNNRVWLAVFCKIQCVGAVGAFDIPVVEIYCLDFFGSALISIFIFFHADNKSVPFFIHGKRKNRY